MKSNSVCWLFTGSRKWSNIDGRQIGICKRSGAPCH